MILHRGNIYLEKEHIEKLKLEEEHVLKRYQAVAKTLLPEPFRIILKKAEEMLGLCKCQMQRIVKRFQEEGIEGLRYKSRRPKTSPNQTPEEIDHQKSKSASICTIRVIRVLHRGLSTSSQPIQRSAKKKSAKIRRLRVIRVPSCPRIIHLESGQPYYR